ncbi:MAG: diversity-generating retroelement protein Avd [Candidatus Promineifilaceae bacterium]|nr:diversity-generating retroelement protein Avd [Anaerolineaceae bacterium]
MKQSPIFSKTYDLLTWLIPTTTKFPREQRFVLARAVQETALKFQERLIEAGMNKGADQESALQQADIDLTKLRFYLRLCQDLGFLKPNQYRFVAERVAEIGRLLGGWQKSLLAK